MRTIALVPMLVIVAVLAACGGDDESGAPPTTTASPSAATGPGISIEEAIASDLEGPLLVNGNLLAEGGEVRLCYALAESFPPQCGGPSLRVEGLDLDEVEGLIKERKVSWTDRPIQLLGTVDDGVLAVSENARA